jgi:Trk K+ transport system NAD-binding subunit
LQHPTPEFDTVLVCGLGKVGYRVVQWLCQLEPQPRIVVVQLGAANDAFVRQISHYDCVTIIEGDARDEDVLKRAGLDRAYAIAAITSDDLTNLQTGLAARRLRPEVHVVLRVFSDALAERLADLFGFHTAYSTSDLASPTLAAAAILNGVSAAFFVGETLFSVDNVTARHGDRLSGRSVEAMRKQYDVQVIGLGSGGRTTAIPAPDRIIAADDEVTLLARPDALAALREA